MKNWFKLFTLKELLVIFTGKVSEKILKYLKYYERYLPVAKIVDEFFGKGYRIERKNGLMILSDKRKHRNLKFSLRPLTSDVETFRQVIEKEEYQPLAELIREHIQGNEKLLIVDAGSNIGLTTLYLSSEFPNSRIVSIEAEKSNYIIQLRNITLNNLNSTVKVYHKALWKNNHEELTVKSDFRDGQNWSKAVAPLEKNSDHTVEKVKTLTLRDIIDGHTGSDKIIDVLKIDIEGAEALLFDEKEFVDDLSKHVKFISIEIHDEFKCRENIYSQLQVNDFEFRDFGETTVGFNKKLI